jgi:hypothetical protein
MSGPTLAAHLSVRGRFARSIRLDKDAGHAERLDGYLPTGRSLEVVRRLAQALLHPAGARAFSITGPYGSGKSSLALFIDALLSHAEEGAHQAALRLIETYDPKSEEALLDARQRHSVSTPGFIRAVITTPQREPITTTVLRALLRGAEFARVAKRLRDELKEALTRAESPRYASPSHEEITELIRKLSSRRPVLLLIDEFGKNLEAFADSGREGDLYLLQELAEQASGHDGLPLIVITIQHLAFEAYAADASAAQRREWAKVQGRFEDIPFVDSAASTRSLIASALVHDNDADYTSLRESASAAASAEAEALGMPTVADAAHVASCYPLHPTALLALPELCARYGQNERTLFSFLASSEPQSVLAFAKEAVVGDPMPWVRLDRVYDYFVESASTFVGASQDASRWIEVETTIRDAHGVTDGQRRVLKTVGVLNLIAAGGALRASAEFIAFAAADGRPGTSTPADVAARLEELEAASILVYRDFAGEYRLWHGSDFDLAGALRSARNQVRQQPPAKLLQTVQALRPIVAARHTIRAGTTRAFARLYADRYTTVPDLDKRGDRTDREAYTAFQGCDGLLLLVVDDGGEPPTFRLPENGLPLVTVTPADPHPLLAAAVELGALLEVARDPGLSPDDRAAQRELVERTAYARQTLDREIADAFGRSAEWTWHNPVNKGGSAAKQPSRRLSSSGSVGLSDVFDRVFAYSPPVLYETINRNELTSQGAKARRILLEAILTPNQRLRVRLGLDGEGPEVAMYRALLADSGLHDPYEGFRPPTAQEWSPIWRRLGELLESASHAPVAAAHVLRELTLPPFGLKDGTASVLLVVGLVVHASDIAVYEHGTFRPKLDAPLAERLVRNPENFGIKHLAAGAKTKRQTALVALGNALSATLRRQPTAAAAAANPTVLTLTRALVDVVHRHDDEFTRKSKLFHGLWDSNVSRAELEQARAVRDALLTAHEPDALLFEHLPAAIGLGPLPASGRGSGVMNNADLPRYAAAVSAAVTTIDSAFDRLSEHVLETICRAANRHTIGEVVALYEDLGETQVLSPGVRRFASVARMRVAYTDDLAWLGAVTESVCGKSLRHWTDHTAPGYLQQLRDSAADYARVAELARFAAGRGDKAFRAYQLDATNQIGHSVREVVAIPDHLVDEVQDLVRDMIGTLQSQMEMDSTTAREALMAALCGQLLDKDAGGGEAMGSLTTTREDMVVHE